MTRRVAGIAVLALTLGALPLLAQGPGPGMPHQLPPMLEHVAGMLHQLDLSDAQKQQLHELMMAERPEQTIGKQVRDAEQKLHVALLTDPQDGQAIESAKAALNAAHAAELDRHVELIQKVAQILTPEQKQQLLKMGPPPAGPRGGRGRGGDGK
jgi:Spy/CpxP family protein refolding chaperone